MSHFLDLLPKQSPDTRIVMVYHRTISMPLCLLLHLLSPPTLQKPFRKIVLPLLCQCHYGWAFSGSVLIIHHLFFFLLTADTWNMESRFSHLRQRDTSVSMLRVKLSRRRSQSQKENRERAVNTRRHLDKLAELEISSLDASIAMANMSTVHEKTMNSTKLDKSKDLFAITDKTVPPFFSCQ